MSDAILDQSASHSHDEEGVASTRGVVLFLLCVVVVIAAVIFGMFAIGPWVLGLTALATVPVIYVVMIVLTMGQ